MLFHFHLPHYFAAKVRKEIEHLYVSMAIGNLAQSIITLFEPIFLYAALGFSVTEVLWFFAAVYILYVLFIPLGGKIASRFGYAHAIFLSVFFQIAFWFLLLGAEKNHLYIYFAPIAFAIQKSLFWPAFHATMSRFANGEQRGREFSVMYAIMNLVQILGPMIGGFLTYTFGFDALIVTASVVYFCSIIPLFWTAEVFVPKPYFFRDTWALYRAYPRQFLGYFGFAEELLALVVWPLFIFILLSNLQDTGTLVTVATLFSTALALYIGIYTDGHAKSSVLKIGTWFSVLSWLSRIPLVSPFGTFISDAFSRTSRSLVMIPISAMIYERAESTHIMPYVVGVEQALAMAKFLAALIGILIFTLTGSFVALFIAASVMSLLYLLA